MTSRPVLQWLTVCGPASYLTVLAVGVLYVHPHPLPPFWPAFVVLLALSSVGTFAFSRFVFVHVQGQEEEIVRRTVAISLRGDDATIFTGQPIRVSGPEELAEAIRGVARTRARRRGRRVTP